MTHARKTGSAEINGTRMYYEMAGAGDPLVLVHAGIADSRMWDAQFDVFAGEFTVLRYDMRGFGRTPAVPGPYAHHRDLGALVDHLDIGPAGVIGCSIGGRTAIDFALARPGAVTALVAVAPGVSGFQGESGDPAGWDDVVAAYERGDLEQAAEGEARIWVDGPRRGPDEDRRAIRALVREMDLIPLAVPDELGDEQQPLEPAAYGRLPELVAPTLVVIGELDQPGAVESSRYLAEHVPHAETVTLPTAHLPNMELPDEFNAAVLEFLRRQRA